MPLPLCQLHASLLKAAVIRIQIFSASQQNTKYLQQSCLRILISESKWSEWGKQLINSDSQSSLTPTDPSKLSDSAWGSFTGSFFESAEKAENSDTKKVPEPVASQPKKSRNSETKSETATSSGLPCDQSKAVISDQPVVGKPISSQSQSSLMEGCSEAEILEFSENCDIK